MLDHIEQDGMELALTIRRACRYATPEELELILNNLSRMIEVACVIAQRDEKPKPAP